MSQVQLIALEHVPLVKPGDDLAALLFDCLLQQGLRFEDGDILALAQKIVSKSEGRLVNLNQVVPSERALAIAAVYGKDPRHVQVILDESREVIWVSPGILVVETQQGYVCANAGVDRSNIEQPGEMQGDEWLALLPENPDDSAAALRQRLLELSGKELAVIINDTHGRPFRMGGVGVCLGSAGLETLVDKRGERDMFGYVLQGTQVATGDELAAAASLLMGQSTEAVPAVVIRGYNYRPAPDSGAASLVRPAATDVFRYPANRKLF
ncbi:coenzyme F420-0:L-glutamate ligase [Candidatus Chlorohelix sp.]|uniref:coenzyme F420-0:L-glutamate ligase n=1 Tax=Candidatus Chlorohelix sp. TaxID=3139201 RepID=UPI00304A7CEF